MKRVIVIVLLAIILAMLMSRRENLTPQCDAGYTLGSGRCLGPCPAGYVADSIMCKMNSCPAGKIDSGVSCCDRNKYSSLVNCMGKLVFRPSKAPKMV